MSDVRVFTVAEADALVPRLTALLPELRRMRDGIIKAKDLHDVEEITSHGTTGEAAQKARETMEGLKDTVRRLERTFEKALKFFEEEGCELKGIDPGLVDFYSERERELVYLCWREGETAVRFWHPLSGGYDGRQPIEE
jgi:hypothetical protein